MKSFLGFVLTIAVIGAAMWFFAPATAAAFGDRVVHYFEVLPPVEEPAPRGGSPAGGTALVAAAPGTAEWRRKDREAILLYENGDFLGAASVWATVAKEAPASEVLRVRAARDRANVFALLARGVVPQAGVDAAAAETEYRRRLDLMRDPAAGAWLELADFAASRSLRHHLAFLYERAFERRAQAAEGAEAAVSRKVAQVLKEQKAAVKELPPDVLDSVIADLPASEAAEVAAEIAGREPGIGGSRPAGDGIGGQRKPQDQKKMAEARKLMAQGDEEYRLAVPGSREVNVHRRKALDLFTKARGLFEEVDRDAGYDAHLDEIHDLNRNIAELRKDLPVGK